MPRVRFVGPDAKAGRQIEGATYCPGDEADLSSVGAGLAIAHGWAVAMPPSGSFATGAVEVEHRDDFNASTAPKRTRKRRAK